MVYGLRLTYRVVSLGEGGITARVGELEMSHQRSQDCAQLHVGELLTNAAMAASTEGKVRAVGTLGDQAVTVVNLLLILVLGGLGLIPAVGVPLERLGKELSRASSDTGGGEDVVSSRNDIVSAFHGHGVLDSANDGVDRSVDTESLLDDLGVQVELVEAFVGERGQVRAQNLELFLVELFHNLRAGSQAQNDPGSGGRRRVLASHKQSNHHVGDFLVRNGVTILVVARHQVPDHILGILLFTSSAALLYDIHVGLGHLLLSGIALAVVGERGPGKHEVDRSETLVEVVVHLSESRVEAVPDFLSLERARGSVDRDLGDNLGHIDGALGVLESGGVLDEVVDLIGDQVDIRAKRLRGKTKLDKLLTMSAFTLYTCILSLPTFFCSMSLALGQS